MTSNDRTPTKLPEATVSRVFDAPVALVYEAWSKPELIARWFGPRGFTLSVSELDLRAGGAFRMVMSGFGTDHPFEGTYQEVVPCQKIVWTSTFESGPQDQVHTTITFEDLGERTRIDVHQCFQSLTPETEPFAEGMQQGWDETIDRLGEFLAAR